MQIENGAANNVCVCTFKWFCNCMLRLFYSSSKITFYSFLPFACMHITWHHLLSKIHFQWGFTGPTELDPNYAMLFWHWQNGAKTIECSENIALERLCACDINGLEVILVGSNWNRFTSWSVWNAVELDEKTSFIPISTTSVFSMEFLALNSSEIYQNPPPLPTDLYTIH